MITRSAEKCSAAELCEGKAGCDPSPRAYACPSQMKNDGQMKIVDVGDHCAVDIVCPPGAVGYENCPWQMPCP